jgi:gamma-glutamyl hydrolase
MSAYVKYMESSGARVVPIIWGEPENVTLDKLSKLDGVLFPGGDGDDYDIGKLVFD